MRVLERIFRAESDSVSAVLIDMEIEGDFLCGEGAGEAGEHGANPEAAKRLEPRGHGAKRSPQGRNTAQALAQGRTKAARCARNRPK